MMKAMLPRVVPAPPRIINGGIEVGSRAILSVPLVYWRMNMAILVVMLIWEWNYSQDVPNAVEWKSIVFKMQNVVSYADGIDPMVEVSIRLKEFSVSLVFSSKIVSGSVL